MANKEQQIGVQRLTKMDLELIVAALEGFKSEPLGTYSVTGLGYKQRLAQIKKKIEQDPKWTVEATQSKEEER